MAKKAVGKSKGKEEDKKVYIKVIRAVKSPKTGAYTFKEEMVKEEDLKKSQNA